MISVQTVYLIVVAAVWVIWFGIVMCWVFKRLSVKMPVTKVKTPPLPLLVPYKFSVDAQLSQHLVCVRMEHDVKGELVMATSHIFRPGATKALCRREFVVRDLMYHLETPRREIIPTSENTGLCAQCAENAASILRVSARRVAHARILAKSALACRPEVTQ